MKKDELIAKQKELIENLKDDLLFFAGKTYTTITIRYSEEEIEALEKAIEQEPVTESVKVPSEKILCDFCPLEKKGVYSVPGGFVAGCEGSHCGTALENMREHQSQVKTIGIGGERFVKPTDKQYIEIALLFNDGKIQKTKIRDMVAMAEFITDRLYENGDIEKPSSKE